MTDCEMELGRDMRTRTKGGGGEGGEGGDMGSEQERWIYVEMGDGMDMVAIRGRGVAD